MATMFAIDNPVFYYKLVVVMFEVSAKVDYGLLILL